MKSKNKPRKRYTMSEAALAQRVAAAHGRRAIVRDWITTKVARKNAEWSKKAFGTVNEALNTLREMEGDEV